MAHELAAFGQRILIMGPSNSGKSTLAAAIAARLGVPAVHLDLLRYEYGGFETLRPVEAFHADHQRAIEQPVWVIEGNYSSCLAERVAQATGAILLDCSTSRSLWRYVRRCLHHGQRIGGFPGIGRERVSLAMIAHIAGATRRNRRRYRHAFEALEIPFVILDGPAALRGFVERAGLDHPFGRPGVARHTQV